MPMFGKGMRILKVLGFEVRIDASWLILAFLVVLSLTGGYFPFHYEGLGTTAYVLMGLVGAVGLFASIVIHELSHSLVARRFGIPMRGITLFMFGGVAQMDQESRTPKGEFLMAIAGPVASVGLAGVFHAGRLAADSMPAPVTVSGVLAYLAWINLVVAVFNLLPAFPLDGGRVLRSGLWAWKKNLRWATRIASRVGSGFGVVLMIAGIASLLTGNIVGGLWWALIGMFLRSVAGGSYRQLVIQEMLSGEPVHRFMKADPVTVSKNDTVQELVEKYMYQHHYKMYPVVDDGRLAGCVSAQDVKQVPRSEWARTTVGEIARDCAQENAIDPRADATEALALMSRTGNTRLVVKENGRLRGVIVLKDLLEFLALKLELEGIDDPSDVRRQARGNLED